MRLRFALVAATIVAIFGSATIARTQTKDVPIGQHPRLPSQPRLARDLIYEAGAPQNVPETATTSELGIARGRALYETHCTTCHGADLRGTTGVPSLLNSGGAGVDFYVGTGRMPDAVKTLQAVHTDPHFTQSQIDAIDAYVSSRATTIVPIERVAIDSALLQRGRTIFEENCQACHGAAAEGAAIGEGWVALALYRASAKQIGEAVRIGPGLMPRFTRNQLSPRDVDAVATYVHYLTFSSPSYGGLTMDYLGPAAEGLVGGVLGVGALFWVIYFTGTKADGTRLSED